MRACQRPLIRGMASGSETRADWLSGRRDLCKCRRAAALLVGCGNCGSESGSDLP